MFALIVAVAAIAQNPEFVAGYKPKVGDKVVLARDEPGRKVPIVKNAGAAQGFQDIVEGSSDSQYEAILEGDEIAEIDAGTPAQIVEDVKYLKDPTIFKIRILAGTFKGKTTYTYASFPEGQRCRREGQCRPPEEARPPREEGCCDRRRRRHCQGQAQRGREGSGHKETPGARGCRPDLQEAQRRLR